MPDWIFRVLWGCCMLVVLYRILTGRDRWGRRPHQVVAHYYFARRFGLSDPGDPWVGAAPWVAATLVILLLLSLFFLWVGSFG